MNYWLMKSEPEVFGIEHLKNKSQQTEHWDGVRNYQARNYMRDGMKYGDQVFFYHSNCKQPGIVGIAKVVRESYPDHTAFDPQSSYYDPRSTLESPRWMMVDIQYKRHLDRPISLKELQQHHEFLLDLPLLRRGCRLSVMPVSHMAWHYIVALEKKG